MDGLSAAASGIAVGSLAVHLINSVQKVHDFLTSLRDAPVEVQAIRQSLDTLLLILRQIESEEQSGAVLSAAVESALKLCKASVDTLLHQVEKLEPGFASKSTWDRSWTAFKHVKSEKRIQKIKSSIETAKSTLCLAVHISARQLHTRQHDAIQKLMQNNHDDLRRHQSGLNQNMLDSHHQALQVAVTKIDNHHQGQIETAVVSVHQAMQARSDEVRISQAGQTRAIISNQNQKMQDVMNGINNLSVRSQAIVSSQSDHTQTITAEIHQMTAKIPFFLRKEIRHAVEETLLSQVGSVTQDQSQNHSRSDSSVWPSTDNATYAGDALKVAPKLQLLYRRSHFRCSWTDLPFGSIQVKTCKMTERHLHKKDRHASSALKRDLQETRITITPAWWLSTYLLGGLLNFGPYELGCKDWKINLAFQRLVADDALIFEFCKSGNVEGVQTLLSRGEASLVDVDSFGMTPLHHAAESWHPALCQILISEGAHLHVVAKCSTMYTHKKSTPFFLAIEGARGAESTWPTPQSPNEIVRQIDTFRQFLTAGTDLVEADEEWGILFSSIMREQTLPSEGASSTNLTSPSSWLHNQYRALIQESPFLAIGQDWSLSTTIAMTTCNTSTGLVAELAKLCSTGDLEKVLAGALDVEFTSYEHHSWYFNASPTSMKPVLECVDTLHCTPEFDPSFHAKYFASATLVELAMRRSRTFDIFRSWLEILGLDIENSVRKEILIIGSNWTEGSLSALLYDRYEDNFVSSIFCKICQRRTWTTRYSEPHWEQRVERIRTGQDPEAPYTEEELSEQEEWEEEACRMLEGKVCIDCYHDSVEGESDSVGSSEDLNESDKEPAPTLLDIRFRVD